MLNFLRVTNHLRLHSALFFVFMLMPTATSTAGTENHCSNLKQLIANVPSKFSKIIVNADRQSGGYDVTLRLEGAMECAVMAQSNKRSYYCVWKFLYRDASAYRKFAELDREVNDCFGHWAISSRDQSVNHPDFYDSRMYKMDQAKVTVSVKDKSALGTTFVYVWVAPQNGQ